MPGRTLVRWPRSDNHGRAGPPCRSVVALAPWVYPTDVPVGLSGQRVLIVHGSRDRIASPCPIRRAGPAAQPPHASRPHHCRRRKARHAQTPRTLRRPGRRLRCNDTAGHAPLPSHRPHRRRRNMASTVNRPEALRRVLDSQSGSRWARRPRSGGRCGRRTARERRRPHPPPASCARRWGGCTPKRQAPGSCFLSPHGSAQAPRAAPA